MKRQLIQGLTDMFLQDHKRDFFFCTRLKGRMSKAVCDARRDPEKVVKPFGKRTSYITPQDEQCLKCLGWRDKNQRLVGETKHDAGTLKRKFKAAIVRVRGSEEAVAGWRKHSYQALSAAKTTQRAARSRISNRLRNGR